MNVQEALTKQNEIKFRVFRCFPIEHKAQLLRQAGQLQKQCTVCQKPEFLGLELTNSSTWPSKIQQHTYNIYTTMNLMIDMYN